MATLETYSKGTGASAPRLVVRTEYEAFSAAAEAGAAGPTSPRPRPAATRAARATHGLVRPRGWTGAECWDKGVPLIWGAAVGVPGRPRGRHGGRGGGLGAPTVMQRF